MEQYISHLPTVYAKVKGQGMNDIDMFIYLKDSELDELCGKDGLALNVMQGIKFKAAIRKLQAQLAPKTPAAIVAISKEEQKAMDEMRYALQQAGDIQSLFESHFNKIDDNAASIKSSVDQEIEKVSKILSARQKALYTEV